MPQQWNEIINNSLHTLWHALFVTQDADLTDQRKSCDIKMQTPRRATGEPHNKGNTFTNFCQWVPTYQTLLTEECLKQLK